MENSIQEFSWDPLPQELKLLILSFLGKFISIKELGFSSKFSYSLVSTNFKNITFTIPKVLPKKYLEDLKSIAEKFTGHTIIINVDDWKTLPIFTKSKMKHYVISNNIANEFLNNIQNSQNLQNLVTNCSIDFSLLTKFANISSISTTAVSERIKVINSFKLLKELSIVPTNYIDFPYSINSSTIATLCLHNLNFQIYNLKCINVTNLDMTECYIPESFIFGNLINLVNLNLYKTSCFDSSIVTLSVLTQLKKLNLSGIMSNTNNSVINNIYFLKEIKLEELNITNTDISLTSVNSITTLKILIISEWQLSSSFSLIGLKCLEIVDDKFVKGGSLEKYKSYLSQLFPVEFVINNGKEKIVFKSPDYKEIPFNNFNSQQTKLI